jgi:hypothetical protein
MLDICVPVYTSNIQSAMLCLEGIEAKTAFPYRLIVCVDGGARHDLHPVELLLRHIKQENNSCQWIKLLWNNKALYEAETTARCLDLMNREYVVVVPGTVMVEDMGWFDKLWRPFQQDSICMLTSNQPKVLATAMQPFRMGKKDVISQTAIFLSKRKFLEAAGWRFDGVDLFLGQRLVDEFHKMGSRCWTVPGIKVVDLDSEEPPVVARKELAKRRKGTEVEVVL